MGFFYAFTHVPPLLFSLRSPTPNTSYLRPGYHKTSMNKTVKTILWVWVLAAITIFGVYAGYNVIQSRASQLTLQRNDIWNKHLVDTAISLLKTGDLVLRMGLGADSYMFAQMNRKNKSYSHSGIVILEHGYPFVYHSIGGEDNPDERLRRDSASFFFSPRHNTSLGIVQYNFAPQQIKELTRTVDSIYKLRPRFDMKFDLATNDQLYCTEFVYKAVNLATADGTYIRPTTFLGKTFIGTDDLFINRHAAFVWQTTFK